MVRRVFVKETGEVFLGGIIGYPVGTAVAGAVEGATQQVGWERAAVGIMTKAVWGLAFLGLAEWVSDQNDDIANVLTGLAFGPIFSVSDDVAKAQEGQSVQDLSYNFVIASMAPAGRPAAAQAAAARRRVVAVPGISFRGG